MEKYVVENGADDRDFLDIISDLLRRKWMLIGLTLLVMISPVALAFMSEVAGNLHNNPEKMAKLQGKFV